MSAFASIVAKSIVCYEMYFTTQIIKITYVPYRQIVFKSYNTWYLL